MPRYAEMEVVVGRRKTGKTGKTLRKLYKAVQNGRKVLIFDATDEYSNYIFQEGQPAHSIKPIFIRDIPRFTVQSKAEIVRIRPFHDNGDVMSNDDLQKTLYIILKTYRNGILLAEDVNVYISDNAPNDIMGKMATLRQAGVDLILHYQLVQKAANPKILGMLNYIRMHKTNDQVARFADRFLDKTEILSIAENIVNRRYSWGMANGVKNEKGQFFSVTVDLFYHKIRGIFTKDEASLAIEEFMSANGSTTIGRELQRRDKNGKKIWANYAEAYQHLEIEMMNQFFTFKQ